MNTDGTAEELSEDISEAQETTRQVEQPTEERQESAPAQLEQLQAELAKAQESYKGLQRKFNKTVEDYRQQADLKAEMEMLKESHKFLVGMLSERGITQDTEEIPTEKRVDYGKKYEAIVAEHQKKQADAQKKAQEQELFGRAQELDERAKKVFANDTSKRHMIRNYIRSGDWDLAEEELASTEANTQVEDKGKKGREALIKSGKIPTDVGGASSASQSRDALYERYATGQMSSEEANKLGLFK